MYKDFIVICGSVIRVAIFPARWSSKRILRKNIKEFNGKPIIAWAIFVA